MSSGPRNRVERERISSVFSPLAISAAQTGQQDSAFMASPQTFPCPKCNRLLQQSGELQIDDQVLPTFQCDECIVQTDFCGEKVAAALTFVLDRDGRPFDPADPEGKLRF